MNGETQLYTLFQQSGEAIDWKADALDTPNVFSPLCGFTATFVLNEAGSHLGLAWYNADPMATMAPSALQIIFPAGTPVGTKVTSSDIKSSPMYKGGLIGFALVGGQTHYSEKKWNPICTACTPNAPWIMSVTYASKKAKDSFYLAFEDGGVSGGGFGNDGDFNDDVFFLSGLTCQGGGVMCDTGQKGYCAAGVTQCGAGGMITCKPLYTLQPEKCDGLDNDCNGKTDDGNLCDPGKVCDHGACVPSCNGGEFGCLGNTVCNAAGHCVDASCKDVSCPDGQVCANGACKGPCDGVVCPKGQSCLAGICKDPCAGVKCDAGQVCAKGACVPSCACTPCAGGTACDAGSGQCVEPACVGKTCAAPQVCAAGACVDACAGAVCPAGETCTMGACVKSMGSGGSGQGGSASLGGAAGAVGVGVGGAGGKAGASTSKGGASGAGKGGAAGKGGSALVSVGGAANDAAPATGGGCGCRVARSEGGGPVAALLAAIAWAARRRRPAVGARRGRC